MKSSIVKQKIHRPHEKNLSIIELIAIALGGMVGGGIFTILGISVSMIGPFTPFAIILGGGIAALAAYSYIKLGVYYKDEGATYSFFKKTFPNSPFSASLIGWWVIFGYISTLALYAYTFASYAISGFELSFTGLQLEWLRKIVAAGIIIIFTLVNIWSVKGMGKLEDIMVYSKLAILLIISFVLINNAQTSLPVLLSERITKEDGIDFFSIIIVASITFVAYEGFQLVINAVNEMDAPEKNIPRAIYAAIILAIFIYVIMSYGAIITIPFDDIIANQEHALAAGANNVLGHWGTDLVVLGALLASSSAISGTMFGASRQMAVIAKDGYFPKILSKRKNQIPVYSILAMALFAIILISLGNLTVILEFGSVTFLVVSVLMSYANFTIRDKTDSHLLITLLSMAGLTVGTISIIYYEFLHQPQQLYFIIGLYTALTLAAWVYAKQNIHE